MSREDNPGAGGSWRKMAEERMAEAHAQAAEPLDPAEMARTVHELMVHQVELELQNAELIETRRELETNSDLLKELYDFAPVGYFSLSANGIVRQLNFMGARMLGRERALLLGTNFADFVSPENRKAFNHFLAEIFNDEPNPPCEVTIVRDGDSPVVSRLTGVLSPNGMVCRMVAMDVTEQRRVEAQAAEKNEDLERIFNLSHDLLGIADNDGRFRRVNPAFERILGYSREELTSCDFLNFVHPDDQQATREAMARLRAGEEIMDFVNRYRCADGSYRWLEWRVTPYGGNLQCALARDITERVNAKDALRESEKRLRLAIDAAQMGSWDWNLRTNELLWTPHHEEMFGYEPGTPRRSYEDFRNRLHPDDAEKVDSKLREAIEKGIDYSCDFRVIWPDGSIHWISGTGRLFHDSEGQPVRMLGMALDITRRKNAEEALRRSERKFRNIVESSPTAMYIYQLDADGRLILREANAAADQELGIEHCRLIGKTLEEAFPDLVNTEIPVMYRAVAKGELGPRQFDIDYDDRGICGCFEVTVFQASPGTIVVAFSDISERKAARVSLEQAREELEFRVQKRTEQLQVRSRQLRALADELSHAEERERRRIAGLIHEDLQQMLVAAVLNLGMLKSKIAGDGDAREFAHIEGILRDSIRTARSLTAELSPPVLQQCGLAAALKWLRTWCGEKYAMDVRVDAEDSADPCPEVGATLFRCVRELLFNVVKHGGVRSADLRMWRTDNDILKIEVSDQGAGFDPLEVRAREGSVGGFGLFSIRERLEWLGGGLEIDSSPGTGSRFILWVPMKITSTLLGNNHAESSSGGEAS